MKYPEDFLDKIILGDCLEIMKDIPEHSIDLIITDPPSGKTACEWDKKLDLNKMWNEFERIGKEGCVYIFITIQPFTTDIINSKRDWFKYDWIWNKVNGSNIMNLKYQPFRTHETILIFSKGSIKIFNPQREYRTLLSLKRYPIGTHNTVKRGGKGKIEHYNIESIDSPMSEDGKKHPSSIITFGKCENGANESKRFNSGFKHPTRKPVALYNYLILTYSNENNIILDPFSGSGTTAISCLQTNRHYIGIEKEKKYFDMSIKRIESFRNEQLFNC